jgi:hypothetical protein
LSKKTKVINPQKKKGSPHKDKVKDGPDSKRKGKDIFLFSKWYK